MHTSSGVDNVDEFAETPVGAGGGTRAPMFTAMARGLHIKPITLSYRLPDGRSRAAPS
jgi:acyl-homoserine-lactone acylase